MKKGKIVTAALVMTAAACSIHVGTDSGSQAPRPAAPPPPAAAPPPPAPAPPPAAPPHAAMGHPHAAMGHALGHTSAPAPSPGAAPHAVRPMTRAPIVAEALNIAKLQQLKARNPKGCGLQEVAPGTWVRIDCHAYKASARAIPHLSARKAKMLRAHKTMWKPWHQVRTLPAVSRLQRAGGERAAGGRDGSIAAVVAESFPGTIDHRADNVEGPIKDQGPVGSCTAFSLSSTLDNQAIRAGKMAPGNRDQAASPNHVWSGYGVPQMGTAADANLGRTIAPLSVWAASNKEACEIADPSFEECGEAFTPAVTPGSWRNDRTLMAKYDSANANGAYKIAGFEQLSTLPPNMDEITQALASGSDLWIAMKIDGYAWSSSRMKNGVIPDWSFPNGGHAVVMSGYRDTPTGRQFLIHNSWGTSWGDKGYAWVTESMVQKYMHYAYKVKIDGGVKKDDVTDDDCAPDELVDLISGLCGLICPDDSRPAGGCPSFGSKKR